jgi:hypothetical protein
MVCRELESAAFTSCLLHEETFCGKPESAAASAAYSRSTVALRTTVALCTPVTLL